MTESPPADSYPDGLRFRSLHEGKSSVPPPEVPLTADRLLAAARPHGLTATRAVRLPSPGIINTVFLLDDSFVVRVPRRHAGCIQQLRREASVIPALVAAGVATPPVVAFDDSCEHLPVPFLVVERVPGVDAETAGLVPPEPVATWRRFGRELALTHATVPPDEVRGDVNAAEAADLGELVDQRASDGWFSTFEAARLHAWITRLAAAAGSPEHVLLHGDAQMSNLLVEPAGGAFGSVIDWGCAHVGGRAVDFRIVPLAATGPMLDGYREVHPATTLEAELLLARLRLVAQALPGGANPGTSWGERPVAWLTDLALGLHDGDPRWGGLLP